MGHTRGEQLTMLETMRINTPPNLQVFFLLGDERQHIKNVTRVEIHGDVVELEINTPDVRTLGNAHISRQLRLTLYFVRFFFDTDALVIDCDLRGMV